MAGDGSIDSCAGIDSPARVGRQFFFYGNRRGAPYVFIEFKIKAVLTKSVQETKKEIKKIDTITHKLLAIE